MIQRFSSAGPNKQMFEMYSSSMNQPENAYGINSVSQSLEEPVIEEVAQEEATADPKNDYTEQATDNNAPTT